jgi:hypothetical protein
MSCQLSNWQRWPASLRAEVVELRAKRVPAEPPPDAQDLAQGTDMFELSFDVETREPKTYKRRAHQAELTATWDRLFRVIGPLMFEEASEKHLQARLNDTIGIEACRTITLPTGHEYASVAVVSSTFDQIKVQLIALGLIEKSTRKHHAQDTATYWTLTGYGNAYLTRLSAIRRLDASPSESELDVTFDVSAPESAES